MKTIKVKRAICLISVSTHFCPLNEEIKAGAIVEYSKIVHRNGEHHIVLTSGHTIPAIFFDV